MKRMLLLLWVCIASPVILLAQNISFEITQGPSPGSVWTDTLVGIRVTIYAPVQVTSANAAIGTRQSALTPSGSSFAGSISLAGLPGDTMQLKLTAEDAQQHQGDTTITFIYRPKNDPGITITVDSTANFAVARTGLFFLNAKATSTAGKDTIRVYLKERYTETLLATAPDSLPTLDLTNYDGKGLQLRIAAINAERRTNEKMLTVFVESSPNITEYITVPGKIIDFKYNKLLVADAATGYPFIFDIATGQRTQVSTLRRLNEGQAFLTPYGAIFVKARSSSSDYTDSLFEWRNGNLKFLRPRAWNLTVAGNYAAYTISDGGEGGGTDFFRRDLAANTASRIYRGGVANCSVNENGTIAFTSVEGNDHRTVYKYQNDTSIALSDPANAPFTDGNRVVFSRYSQFEPYPYALYLHYADGQPNILLHSAAEGYNINKLYVAYGIGSKVILRDTAGANHSLSSGGTGAIHSVEALNLKGEVMAIATNGRFFLSKQDSGLVTHSVDKVPDTYPVERASRAYEDSSGWYVAIGRTLFKVNRGAADTVHVTDFEKSIASDSVLAFKAADFTDHFSGGQLAEIKVLALPKHGTLKYGTATLTANSVVPADSLARLTYTPDSTYRGMDTLRWTASNGAVYAKDTAAVYIQITGDTLLPVPQPQITGLSATYCSTQDDQHVKIINLPGASSGITVKVLLDGTQSLPVAGDSTFTLQPATLAAGKHTVEVSYSRDTAQKKLAADFTITEAVTPEVDITVNINPITNDTTDVIFTATAVSGGGKKPLYTFARDRDFSNILRVEGTDNKATVSPTVFALGDNWVYVRLRTSETCAALPTATDSIKVTKTNVTGIVDIDFPKNHINAFPNPFRGQFTIRGLQPVKTYLISLHSIQGKLMYRKRSVNREMLNVNEPSLGPGMYILSVFDEKKGRLIGSTKLMNY